MRRLQTHDVFMAMKIVKAVGVSEEIKKVALIAQNKKNVNQKEIGIELIFNIIGNCSNDDAEKMFYEFIGGILEINPGEIREMDPMELIENIKKLNEVISVEQWKSFFQSLLALIQQQM